MTNIKVAKIGNIYIAHDLLAMLRNLTLVGQNDEGQLEWMGNAEEWGRYWEETIDHN